MLLLIAAAFFLAVKNNTDTDQFFMRHQAKDAGLIIQAVHAANGDLVLDYAPHPEKQYVATFLRHSLVVSKQPRGTHGFGGGYRQPYGSSASVTVEETVLDRSLLLTIRKEGGAIRFNETTSNDCVRAVLPERTTKLVLNTEPSLAEKLRQLPLVQRLEATRLPERTISLTVVTGEPKITVGGGVEMMAAQHLACLLAAKLRIHEPLLAIDQSVAAHGYVSVTISVPRDGPIDEANLASTIAQVLDASVEGSP